LNCQDFFGVSSTGQVTGVVILKKAVFVATFTSVSTSLKALPADGHHHSEAVSFRKVKNAKNSQL
jgi:hypothetical protein